MDKLLDLALANPEMIDGALSFLGALLLGWLGRLAAKTKTEIDDRLTKAAPIVVGALWQTTVKKLKEGRADGKLTASDKAEIQSAAMRELGNQLISVNFWSYVLFGGKLEKLMATKLEGALTHVKTLNTSPEVKVVQPAVLPPVDPT